MIVDTPLLVKCMISDNVRPQRFGAMHTVANSVHLTVSNFNSSEIEFMSVVSNSQREFGRTA